MTTTLKGFAFDLMAHVEANTEEEAFKILEEYLCDQAFNQPNVDVGGFKRVDNADVDYE